MGALLQLAFSFWWAWRLDREERRQQQRRKHNQQGSA